MISKQRNIEKVQQKVIYIKMSYLLKYQFTNLDRK
jgi:hypothetical protein